MTENRTAGFPAPLPVKTRKITASIYGVYEGAGANSYFITGKNSMLVIDAKMTEESGKAVLEEVRKVSALPVSKMLITHSDRDHVNGLSAFPTGIKIISSEITKTEMKYEFEAGGLSALFQYLPSETFSDKYSLDFDGKKLELYHIGPGHTGGDTIIHFPAEKTAFIGDLIFIGRPPLIHRQKNGSSTGLLNSLKFLLSLDCENYLSGHADPAVKKDVEEVFNRISSTREKVLALKARGKSMEEMKIAMGVVDMEPPPGRPKFPSIEEVIYMEK